MSIQISAADLANLVTKLLTKPSTELSGAESFSAFMTDITQVVCNHCGGVITHPADAFTGEFLIGLIGDGNEATGTNGVFAEYDPEGEYFPITQLENTGT